MSRYQAYPEYKDSGLVGLGLIPRDWKIMQLKRSVTSCVNGIWGAEPNNDGLDIIVIRVADFDRQKLSINDDGFTYRKIEEKEKIGRLLRRGDLLLEKSGGGEKTLVGQVVLFDKEFEAVTSNFVAKMTPINGFESRYLNYVFCRFYSQNINFCSIKQNTGIQNLDSASYLSEEFCFPSFGEQQTIANFLDHETAKIDTLIEQQQKLIQLLKEKRQAVISHAVTKGLNPDAPMKDSGVEWLGEVPEGWSIVKISYIGRVLNGSTPDKGNLSYWTDGTIPWLASSCLNSDFVEEPTEMITEDAYKNSSVELIPSNSLLVGMVGQGKTRGTSAILKIDSCINQNMAAIIPYQKIKIEFLFYIFITMYDDLRELGRGGNQAALNCEIISSLKIPLPSIEEQELIISYIKKNIEKIEKTNDFALDQIELMQERRTALISAAVTGKIDVRGWQAPTAN